MARRRTHEPAKPDLPEDRALAALKSQLIKLENLKNRSFREAENEEKEWQHLTESIIRRAFGEDNPNMSKFFFARSAGEHYVGGMSESLLQRNFEKRIEQFEALLRSLIAELQIFMPETEVEGAYEPGDEYLFYRDLKNILRLAANEIFVVDNFLDSQLFDVYFEELSPGISVRVLTDQVRGGLLAVAEKYATRGDFELRTSRDVHDRVVFADDRCWVIGQSIKDAAKKKPTYIVEHGSPTMKPIYENIWSSAGSIVKS